MDFKHFSHSHPLTYHQTPPEPTADTLVCSGCNLHIPEAPNTFYYTCWQCQFFLHDQCYRATRSLSHPTHSSHPLSLIPYPTYPSGSFICHTCNLQGTGFSYSCPNCDFDLHVHCAHINLNNNNFLPGIQNNPIAYPSAAYQNNLFPPSQNQNFGDTNIPYQNTYPPGPSQFPNGPPSLNQNFVDPSLSYQTTYPPNPTQFPGTHYSLTPENVTNNIPIESYPAIHTHNYHNQNNYPPSQAQYANTHHPIIPESVPYLANSVNTTASGTASNPTTAVAAPAVAPAPQPHGVKHYSHEHPLDLSDVKQKNVMCNACEKEVTGLGYKCVNSGCKFSLHRECFGLPRELQHKSHKEHPLTLFTVPACKEGTVCNGCLSTTGTSFTYRCSTCDFDLHSSCAFLPETMKRNDHAHSLSLVHSLPDYKEEDEEHVPACDVCQGVVDVKNSWFYLCQECDFGTHLNCVNTKMPTTQTDKTNEDLLAAALIELQVLQLKERLSKMNASFQV